MSDLDMGMLLLLNSPEGLEFLDTSLGEELCNIKLHDICYGLWVTGEEIEIQGFASKIMNKLESFNIPCLWYSGENCVEAFANMINKRIAGETPIGIVLHLPDKMTVEEFDLFYRAAIVAGIRGGWICLLAETPSEVFFRHIETTVPEGKVLLKHISPGVGWWSAVCLSPEIEDEAFIKRFNLEPYPDQPVLANIRSERRTRELKLFKEKQSQEERNSSTFVATKNIEKEKPTKMPDKAKDFHAEIYEQEYSWFNCACSTLLLILISLAFMMSGAFLYYLAIKLGWL